MFAGVVQPYIKNRQITYCPEAGKTNWRVAIDNPRVNLGYPNMPYVKALDERGIY